MILFLLLYYFSQVSGEWTGECKMSTTRQSHRCRLFSFLLFHRNHSVSSADFPSDNVQPWQPSFFLSSVYSGEKIPLKNYLIFLWLRQTRIVHHWQPCCSCRVHFVITNTCLVAFFPYCNIKQLLIDLSICCYSSKIVVVSVLWFSSQNVYRGSIYL